MTPEAMFKRGNRRLAARRLADREADENSAEIRRLNEVIERMKFEMRLMSYAMDARAFVELLDEVERRRDKSSSRLDSSEDGRAIN
jgi:hypothetical protein